MEPAVWTGSGTYQLDQRAFTFDIRSSNVQLLGLTLPGGEIVRGPVELAATGAGTVSDPGAKVEFAAPDLQFGAYELGRIAINAVVDGQAGDDRCDRRSLRGERRCGHRRRDARTLRRSRCRSTI